MRTVWRWLFGYAVEEKQEEQATQVEETESKPEFIPPKRLRWSMKTHRLEWEEVPPEELWPHNPPRQSNGLRDF